MNRTDAKIIAETITNEQLYEMLLDAKANIMDWTARSNVNKSLSNGAAWNILAHTFDINVTYRDFSKHILIREYGEFLPDTLKVKKKKKVLPKIIHQEPKFKK